MPINPIARYMILCDDWMLDPANIARVHIIGLISNIRPLDDPPYPLLVPELGVFLAPDRRPRFRGRARSPASTRGPAARFSRRDRVRLDDSAPIRSRSWAFHSESGTASSLTPASIPYNSGTRIG